MKNYISFRFIILTFAICGIATITQAFQNKHREFSRTKEKELRVILEVSFASISIERGHSDKIAVVDYDEEETEKHKLYISYEISNKSGTLRIKLKNPTQLWGDNDEKDERHRRLDIKLSDAIPIVFDFEIGAGKGDINLTDLQVKELHISAGASSVTMKCDKPNPIIADKISIKSGVSKFKALDLANLNFRNMKFSGGLGAYRLDFNGKFRQSAEVQIEVGLGSIRIDIPKIIEAKLIYDDNWLSSFHIEDDFKKKDDGVYETNDFQDASKRLTIRLESGLGSVKINRE